MCGWRTGQGFDSFDCRLAYVYDTFGNSIDVQLVAEGVCSGLDSGWAAP